MLTIIGEKPTRHAQVSIHHGKTQVWNRGGAAPPGVEELTRLVKPEATVWVIQLPARQPGRELPRTLRSRSRVAVHWSSWADCVHMIKQRRTSRGKITGIHQDFSPCFVSVRHCQGLLEGARLDVPSWRSLADTPPVLEPEADPTEPKRGQHRADVWKNDTETVVAHLDRPPPARW